MRLYEGMFLLDSNLASKDWTGLEKHIQDILQRHQAEVLYSEKWPDRRLAYDVAGCKKGTYYLTYFKAPSASIQEIRRDVNLSERILRHLIVQEAGLEQEMERRKNREIEIPPADLSFDDDRFSFSPRGRFRRESAGEEPRRASSRAETSSPPETRKESGEAEDEENQG